MDGHEKKKFVQKRPPDKEKRNKPKYIPKEEAVQQPQLTKKENQPQKKKVHERRSKNYYEKQPQLYHAKSSESGFGCMICSEKIKVRDPIWTCPFCFISLHLKCIKQWIDKTNEEGKKLIFNWQCIQCKHEFNQAKPQYFCYCGKEKNPQFDRDLEEHSCGRPCGKKRGNFCPHPCPQLCHSGKCKPCEHEGATILCHCGKSERKVRCSEDRPIFQCGKKCQKMLTCQKHKCERNCHQGPCLPCKKKHLAKCYCGKNDDVIDCEQVSYGCGQACERILDCGFHKCEQQCHIGECSSCSKTPDRQKTCPCGRYQLFMISELQRTSCKDPIPSCGMPCKKIMACGHECPLICHEGRCPECKIGVQQSCVCQTAQRKIQCWKATSNKFQFICETVCKKKRSCGIHTCNQVCCKAKNSPFLADHTCELTCQKMLNCEKHTCDMPCHAGNCKKCPVIYSQPQPCPCGSTFLRPPIVCGNYPPQCENPCNKVMECGHKCLQLCHYGPCRCIEEVLVQCRCKREKILTTCGKQTLCMNKCKQRLDCGHLCLVQCHAGKCQVVGKNGCKKKCDRIRNDCQHKCRQICHPSIGCEELPCEAEILIKCECGHRQTTVLCGSKKGQKIVRKQIKCNSKCENLKRFDIFYKGKQIYYPNQLVQFGFKNFVYLQKIEEKIAKFILESDQHFIQVDFKMIGDFQSKNALMNLFENHYHLNTHFYRHMKSASFTLMQTEDTMIPKPCLSDYIKQIGKGYVKRTSLPFDYTIKFDGEPRQRVESILRTLKQFLHKYYIERKDKMILAHFWEKEEGLKAKNLLQNEHQLTDFRGEQNLNKLIQEEEIINEEQIIQKETELNTEQNHKQEKVEQQVRQAEQKKQAIQEIEQKKQQKQSLFQQIVTKKEGSKKIIVVEQKKPKIIVRPLAPNFIRSQYPPSSENVQDLYKIDEEDLFKEKVDWDSLVKELKGKKMGIQASQWRIRALIMIEAFHPLEEKIIQEEFSRIFGMYEKDKQKAERILSIQKIDTKNVKDEMRNNQIYLSDYQPQITAYFLINNYLSHDKIEYIPSEQVANTMEVQKVLRIIESIEQINLQQFYDEFKSSDYVLSCCLLSLVHQIRKRFMETLQKKKKYEVRQTSKWLLFQNDEQLIELCKKNGLSVSKKYSKSRKENIWEVSEGKLQVQMVKDHKFELAVQAKRDKQFFLCEDEEEELVDNKWMTKSFFAFGDFRQSVSSKYMMTLCRRLKGNY